VVATVVAARGLVMVGVVSLGPGREVLGLDVANRLLVMRVHCAVVMRVLIGGLLRGDVMCSHQAVLNGLIVVMIVGASIWGVEGTEDSMLMQVHGLDITLVIELVVKLGVRDVIGRLVVATVVAARGLVMVGVVSLGPGREVLGLDVANRLLVMRVHCAVVMRVLIGGLLRGNVVCGRNTILSGIVVVAAVRMMSVRAGVRGVEGTVDGTLVEVHGLDVVCIVVGVVQTTVSVMVGAIVSVHIIIEVVLVNDTKLMLIGGHFISNIAVSVAVRVTVLVGASIRGVESGKYCALMQVHGLDVTLIIELVIKLGVRRVVSRVVTAEMAVAIIVTAMGVLEWSLVDDALGMVGWVHSGKDGMLMEVDRLNVMLVIKRVIKRTVGRMVGGVVHVRVVVSEIILVRVVTALMSVLERSLVDDVLAAAGATVDSSEDGMLMEVDGLDIVLVIVFVIKRTVSGVVGRVVHVRVVMATALLMGVVGEGVMHGTLVEVHGLDVVLIVVSVVQSGVGRVVSRVVTVVERDSVSGSSVIVAAVMAHVAGAWLVMGSAVVVG